jgi:hypothetical protein
MWVCADFLVELRGFEPMAIAGATRSRAIPLFVKSMPAGCSPLRSCGARRSIEKSQRNVSAGFAAKAHHKPWRHRSRGWRKTKWLNRQEFVVVDWSDPEGSRPHLGALLLGYYTDDGKLIYAGRVSTGMSDKVLADLRLAFSYPISRGFPVLPRTTRVTGLIET